MPGQHFFIELFQYAVGDTNKNNGLSTQFLIDTGAMCSISNCDTFTEIEKIQPLVVMPLEKSPLAANGHAMPMKGKVVIQSAFDVEYSCVIEHTVYVSDSPEARMNILGIDFLAKFLTSRWTYEACHERAVDFLSKNGYSCLRLLLGKLLGSGFS